MTTFADGVYQFGGMPVGNSFAVSKIFSTPIKGRAWFVDTAYGGSGTGKSPKTAFNTMAQAFSVAQSGDVIYFVGKVTEQLVTPVQVFDVTVVGCGNRPRHADSSPTNGNQSAATWAAPASPTAATPLCQVIQQGWRFVNILWAGSAGCSSLNPVRNAASGDSERDGSHMEVIGCRFAGVASTDTGVLFGKAGTYTENVFNVLIEDNIFQSCATAIGGNFNNQIKIYNNRFIGNTNDIVFPAAGATIKGNVMSLAPTGSIVISGGTGGSQVHGNYLPGTYADGTLYAPGTSDNWNGNYASTGVTAAVPA